MRVLIACEYSGSVRDAFIKAGHQALSCDLLPTDVPGPHYQGDVFDVINDGWDLMIAHPPCTYLSVAGAWCLYKKDGTLNEKRWQQQRDALDFVKALMSANIDKIAIENPVSVISSQIRKPDQIIQPWQFGHKATKTTCLWLKNLPKLKPTEIVDKGEFKTWVCSSTGKIKRQTQWIYDAACKARTVAERQKIRSKTFQGIANAMADQWGADQ